MALGEDSVRRPQRAQKSSNVVGVQSSALAALSSSSARPRGIPALSERRWQQQVVILARLRGYYVHHEYDARRGTAGMPDLLLIRRDPPRCLWAELKTDTGKLRSEQREVIDMLRAAGQEVYVWRPADLPDVQRILEAA